MNSARLLRVGIDFDNTIVCYDDIFYKVALEKGLIPADLPANKESVRDFLRSQGKEDLWTEMQGYVYGARMSDVVAFRGALECIEKLKANNIPLFIISHKTRHPYRGEAYDLHASARQWLKEHLLAGSDKAGLEMDHVFFKETKEEKLAQVSACGCTHFIDDLPEFFAEPSFPSATRKLLFSPSRNMKPSQHKDLLIFASWGEITRFLLDQ